jgi:hypothetical protein
MSTEQHRRLIGNDVAVIFFQEETAFEANIDAVGSVPQIFAVVQPHQTPDGTKYR